MSVVHKMFTEKLRPKNMKEIILLDRVRRLIGDPENLNKNLLFVSQSPGTGKSSVAGVIAKFYPTLKINASRAGNIETVRTSVINHCSTMSMTRSIDDDIKIVFFDEFDGGSKDFYEALRGEIERFAGNVRFIATCNNINAIPIPIRDRFTIVNFLPTNKDEENELLEKYKERIRFISSKLKFEWDSEETLDKFIRNAFPSFRRIVSQIQDIYESETKIVTMADVARTSYSFTDLYKLLVSKPDPYNNYKSIMTDYSQRYDEVFESLGQEFPKWLQENKPNLIKHLGEVCVLIADWSYKSKFCIDSVLALIACFYEIQTVLQN